MRHKIVWTAFLDNALRELWDSHTVREITEKIGISNTPIYARANLLGLPTHRRYRKINKPPHQVWVNAAKAEAAASGVKAKEIICGVKRQPVAEARWRAFRAVLDQHPECSIYGLARVSGFDHTSILHGLARLQGKSANDVKAGSRASGRRPGRRVSLEAAE